MFDGIVRNEHAKPGSRVQDLTRRENPSDLANGTASRLVLPTPVLQQDGIVENQLADRSQFDWLAAALRCHSSLRSLRVASEIAQAGASLHGVERIQVLIQKKRRLLVSAVSGVDRVARRSSAVRATQLAAESCRPLGEPVVYPSSRDLPPQVAQALDEYVDSAVVTSAIFIPLIVSEVDLESDERAVGSLSGDLNGYLVAEKFEGRWEIPLPGFDPNTTSNPKSDEESYRALVQLSRIASSALSSALEHEKTPLRWATWWLADLSKTTRVLLALLFLLGALAACGSFTTVDRIVHATGRARPDIRRHVFVGENAIVKRIHVIDGQRVREGERLMTLYSPDLTLKVEELRGELRLLNEELVTLQTRRGASANQGAVGPQRNAGIASDDVAGRMQLVKLDLQLTQERLSLLQKRRADLAVESPIDGVVSLVGHESQWLGRPIAKGTLVMDIFQPEGNWVVEAVVPIPEAARLLEVVSSDESSVNPPGESNAADDYSASVGWVASPTEVVPARVVQLDSQARFNPQIDGHGVNVRLDLEGRPPGVDGQLESVSGLAVMVRIKVGRQSLFSWMLRDLAEWCEQQIRFRATVVSRGTQEQ